MRTRITNWLGALFLVAAPLWAGCGGVEPEVGNVSQAVRPGICAILCLAPPEGCEYVGGRTTGPCNSLSCGHLRCKGGSPECPVIDCAAPPEGCHYEGMITSPCARQTCGTLVCDGNAP